MSSVEPDKLSSTATQGASPQSRRPRPQVWPAETGESLDTFATPSEAPEPADAVLEGPEPAVFGGLNPDQVASDELSEPLGTPLEEAVRGDELIPEAPDIEWGRVIRSSWFLLSTMIVLLVGGSVIIGFTVPTETWVETSITFNQYKELTTDEALDLQSKINAIVRNEPLKKTAQDVLAKKSPDVPPGFLKLRMFYGRDDITWTDEGELRLRVESRDPSRDLTRLDAVVDAFHIQMLKRNEDLDQLKVDLAAQQATLAQQEQTSQALDQEIDSLLEPAERYAELKQAMQGLVRYLEVEDESNPLRLVARQNLSLLSQEVAEARELGVRRDDLMKQHEELLVSIPSTQAEIARLDRAVKVFAFASPPDPKKLRIHDTRDVQKYIMRGWWVLVIVAYGALVAGLHIIDSREAERARRERREILKRRPKNTAAQTTK